MKNQLKLVITAVVLAILSINTSIAQDYKPIEVDLGARFSGLTGDYEGGGVGLFLEPRYNVNNKLAVGLRLGFDVLGSKTGETTEATLLPSYVLTGDYMLLSHKNKRLFAGLGVGMSGRASLKIDDLNDENSSTTRIGSSFVIVPRVGVKLGILKLSLDYNIYSKATARNSVGLNLGFSFGGGIRR